MQAILSHSKTEGYVLGKLRLVRRFAFYLPFPVNGHKPPTFIQSCFEILRVNRPGQRFTNALDLRHGGFLQRTASKRRSNGPVLSLGLGGPFRLDFVRLRDDLFRKWTTVDVLGFGTFASNRCPICMRRAAALLTTFIVVACGHKVPVDRPPDPEAFNHEGLIAFHLGTPESYTRAAEAFRRALSLKPESCDYALNLAQALWFLASEQQLNFEEYLPSQKQAAAIVESSASRCTASDESRVLGLRALTSGRGPAASDLINRAVDLDPKDPMNWLVLGCLDPTSSHLATAEGSGRWVAMKSAVDLNPQSALFEYEYGRNVQFRPRAQNEPANAFKRAIELNPKHFRGYLNLAYAGIEGTDVEALYQKVVEIAPKFLEGRIAIGSYYASVDEIEKSENQYSAAVAANPKYDVAEFRLGLLMLQAERPQEAEKHFRRVVDLSPGSFEAHYYLGNIASDRKDYDEALRQYGEAVSLRTNYAEAEYGIGWAYRQQGRIEAALSEFDKVIRMLPSNATAYVARADIRVEQMNFTGALADYQKAIEAFETQIQGLTAAAEKKRRERDKASVELALTGARRTKLSIEEATRNR